jgi:hypothetical protein
LITSAGAVWLAETFSTRSGTRTKLTAAFTSVFTTRLSLEWSGAFSWLELLPRGLFAGAAAIRLSKSTTAPFPARLPLFALGRSIPSSWLPLFARAVRIGTLPSRRKRLARIARSWTIPKCRPFPSRTVPRGKRLAFSVTRWTLRRFPALYKWPAAFACLRCRVGLQCRIHSSFCGNFYLGEFRQASGNI